MGLQSTPHPPPCGVGGSGGGSSCVSYGFVLYLPVVLWEVVAFIMVIGGILHKCIFIHIEKERERERERAGRHGGWSCES